MDWFRMYGEFATDPKVQMMSEADQRRFVMLLCLRCSNGDVTLHETEIAFQLRISNEEWAISKALFMSKGLIDEGCQPTAWDRRQFVSDSSRARVAAHRAKKKQAGNVTVTPPDTDTDTDTEEDQKHSATSAGNDLFAKFWSLYPNKKGKAHAEKSWKKLKVADDLFVLIEAGLAKQVVCPEWTKDGGQFIPHPATWLNGKRWEDEVKSSSNVHQLPSSRHAGFSDRDYTAGLIQREDGSYAF